MSQLIDLKVGFSCNNKCQHCVVSDKFSERDLTLRQIIELTEGYIAKYKSIKLTLTGGEVTIRKDYLELMDYIKNKKNDGAIEFVDLQTNGRMLAQDSILEGTLPVVDFFLIALHSYTSSIHDKITRRTGSYDETTTALKKISTKIPLNSIAVQTVISRINYSGLHNLYKFCFEEFGLLEFNMTFPHPIGWANDIRITPQYCEVSNDINEALSYCLNNDIHPFLEAIPLCVFSDFNRDYAIDFYGKRSPDVVGFGGEKDGHIDYAIANQDGYGYYESCEKCSYRGICTGVWKEYMDLYPAESLPVLR